MSKRTKKERTMASQRTPEQLKTVILKAAQHPIAVGGMQNFSYPKLAAETERKSVLGACAVGRVITGNTCYTYCH